MKVCFRVKCRIERCPNRQLLPWSPSRACHQDVSKLPILSCNHMWPFLTFQIKIADCCESAARSKSLWRYITSSRCDGKKSNAHPDIFSLFFFQQKDETHLWWIRDPWLGYKDQQTTRGVQDTAFDSLDDITVPMWKSCIKVILNAPHPRQNWCIMRQRSFAEAWI